jgi:FKBP-type peptidyl-prolyl cis-trans isomerase
MNHPTKALILLVIAAAAAYAQDAKVPAEAGQAAEKAPMTAPAVTPAAPTFTDEQLLEELGWLVGKKTGLAEWGFKPAEAQIITRGVYEALSGKESPYEVQKVGPAMDEFIQKKQTTVISALKEKNTTDAVALFAKLKADSTVVELPDGLRYKVIIQGDTTVAKPTDWVKVNYTGTLVNGTIFDTSERAGKPAEFQLNKVIPGWTEGLQKVGKGGKIMLWVPAPLAYGDDGRPGIPPGAVLIFSVDVLDISAAAFPPAAAK